MQIYQDMVCPFDVYTNTIHAKEVADSQTLPNSEPDYYRYVLGSPNTTDKYPHEFGTLTHRTQNRKRLPRRAWQELQLQQSSNQTP